MNKLIFADQDDFKVGCTVDDCIVVGIILKAHALILIVIQGQNTVVEVGVAALGGSSGDDSRRAVCEVISVVHFHAANVNDLGRRRIVNADGYFCDVEIRRVIFQNRNIAVQCIEYGCCIQFKIIRHIRYSSFLYLEGYVNGKGIDCLIRSKGHYEIRSGNLTGSICNIGGAKIHSRHSVDRRGLEGNHLKCCLIEVNADLPVTQLLCKCRNCQGEGERIVDGDVLCADTQSAGHCCRHAERKQV